jgi:hypothetical protein
MQVRLARQDLWSFEILPGACAGVKLPLWLTTECGERFWRVPGTLQQGRSEIAI